MPCLRSQDQGVILAIFVQPRASRNQVVGLQGDELKVRLTSPPVDGAANTLCIKFLAKYFGLSRRDVELISGATSRHKRIFIHGMTIEQVRGCLADFL